MTDMTPAQMRARARDALRPLGEERRKLTARQAQIDEELRPLIVEALRMEVPEREIQEETGIARGTIRRWGGK